MREEISGECDWDCRGRIFLEWILAESRSRGGGLLVAERETTDEAKLREPEGLFLERKQFESFSTKENWERE